jgi:Domain of unknown function (DUF4203)
MLPHAYGLPASIVLTFGGAIACFAGYRLFRVVLGIYGFILGAMIASSVMGSSNTMGMLIGAVVGGIAGAAILMMAYFVGIGLVGAGLGVLIGQTAWSVVAGGEPPVVAVIVVALAGAIGAMMLQRYVIIVGTAFGGAWTMVVGATNVMAMRGLVQGASATEVWILYPTTLPAERWAPAAWIALGLMGLAAQMMTTSGNGKSKR